tara:strand:- start:341 stop:4219 length:3879 start_codon:yes stop_codon:yes gene_type:complete
MGLFDIIDAQEKEDDEKEQVSPIIQNKNITSNNSLFNIIDAQEEENKVVTPQQQIVQPVKEITQDTAKRDYEEIRTDPKIREAALRFSKDKLNLDNVDEDEAITRFIRHFRSFNVNELTAGLDWNYISAVSSDSEDMSLPIEERQKAQQKLQDYALLYQTFPQLPDFYEEGGAEGAFGDYFRGIMSAPSTLFGIFLPGIGKGAGIASTQAAKAAVNKTIFSAIRKGIAKETLKKNKGSIFTNTYKALGNRPILTSSIIEGAGGGLQNVAMQKVEQEIGLRDSENIDKAELALFTGIGAGTNAALGVATTKLFAGKAVGKFGQAGNVTKYNKILTDADKKIIQKNKVANEKAEIVLRGNKVLTKKIKNSLKPLDPESVEGGKTVRDIEAEKLGLKTPTKTKNDKSLLDETVPAYVLSIDPKRVDRIYAAGVEILLKSSNPTLKKGERITEGISRTIRELNDKEPEKALGNKLLKEIMDEYDLTGNDFSNLFMAVVSDSARVLQSASQAKKLLFSIEGASNNIFTQGREAKDALLKIELAAKNIADKDYRSTIDKLDTKKLLKLLDAQSKKSFFDRIQDVDKLRLAFMTSQPATTFRNTISGYSRIGFDVATKVADRSLVSAVKFFGGAKGKAGLMEGPNDDALAVIMGLANTHETNAIDSMFKLGYSNLTSKLYRELQDIESAAGKNASGKLRNQSIIGKELNALNTISDNFFKRVAFIGNIKRKLNENYARRAAYADTFDLTKDTQLSKFKKEFGVSTIKDAKAKLKDNFNMNNILARGKFNETFNSKEGTNVLTEAFEEALYFTYQKTPNSAAAKALINSVHKLPFLATSFVPFPRFIANALRFTYEYSPAYIVQGAYRSFIKPGSENYEEIAKSLVGVGVLAGAIAIREQQGTGTNWYEYKLPSGDTIDMRPFFPAAPYLFAADMIVRSGLTNPIRKQIATLTGQKFVERPADPIMKDRGAILDIAQALTGTQFRAGLGLYILDDAFNDATKGRLDGVMKIFGNGVGNIANTFTIPLTFPQDIYNTFLAEDEYRQVRETKSSDLLSLIVTRSLSRVPGNLYFEKKFSDLLGTRPSEPKKSAFTGETIRRKAPFSRQVFGATLTAPKNYLESEMIRLRLNPSGIIKSRTGVPEADNLFNDFYGDYAELYIIPALKANVQYEQAKKVGDTVEQRRILKDIVRKHKSDVKELVEEKYLKEVKGEVDEMGVPLTVGKEKFGIDVIKEAEFYSSKYAKQRDRAIKLYEERHGKPKYAEYMGLREKKYNYTALLYYAEEIKKRDGLSEKLGYPERN